MKKIIIGIALIFLVFSGFFATPVSFVHAGAPPGGGTTTIGDTPLTGAGGGSVSSGAASVESELNSCNIITSFSLCVLWFIYHVFLGLSFWAAEITGKLFDFFISYTLNSNAYTSPFIVKGWGVIRDLANVMFIFTLLYLAIRHILGMSSKKYIPTLIIVALLLNFSLFFTRVAIDAGNILARAFYNTIVIDNDVYAEEIGFKSISVGLLTKINPQKILTDSLFSPKFTTQVGDYSTASGQIETPAAGTPAYLQKSLDDNFGYYAFIFILLGIINFVLAWVFLSVALLFLGRTIGLWFAMIFSPVAFITLAVPGSAGFLKQLSFDSWKDTVLKLAFVAPIFIFFLYLTIMFLSVIFSTPIPVGSEDTSILVLKVFIPFVFVIVILRYSKKIAEDMAGDFGGAVKSMVGKVLGFAGGIALGGTALVGRKVIGGLASSQLKSGGYEKRIADASAAGDHLKARRLMATQKALINLREKATFDVRNLSKGKGALGQFSGFVGGQLTTGFAGKDFNVGKGSDVTQKKYEDAENKKKLKRGEELRKVHYGEREGIIADGRKLTQEEIEALNESKKAIEEGFKTETAAITKRLDELVLKDKLTDDETSEMRQLEKRQDEGIPEDRKAALDKKDKEIEAKKATLKDEGSFVTKEEKRRREAYADRVLNQKWYDVRTSGNAGETASKIRRGDKAESDKDKLFRYAKQANVGKTGGDAPKPEAKPEAPAPEPTPAPEPEAPPTK